jgi:hypothetical protein
MAAIMGPFCQQVTAPVMNASAHLQILANFALVSGAVVAAAICLLKASKNVSFVRVVATRRRPDLQ